jgi:hypothetical protein
VSFLGKWNDKKGKSMKGLAVVPDDEKLFDFHLTSGLGWGSCVVQALNVYFNKRVDVMMGFTTELEKEIIFEGATFKLFNIMALHYKQKKKMCNAIKVPLEKIKEKMAILKSVNQT